MLKKNWCTFSNFLMCRSAHPPSLLSLLPPPPPPRRTRLSPPCAASTRQQHQCSGLHVCLRRAFWRRAVRFLWTLETAYTCLLLTFKEAASTEQRRDTDAGCFFTFCTPGFQSTRAYAERNMRLGAHSHA